MSSTGSAASPFRTASTTAAHRGRATANAPDVIARIHHFMLIAKSSIDLITGVSGLRDGLVHWRSLTTSTREQMTSLRSQATRSPSDRAQRTKSDLDHLSTSIRAARIARRGRPDASGFPAGAVKIDTLASALQSSLDLQPSHVLADSAAAHDLVKRARQIQRKIPHGTASRSTKPIPFNGIDRWVL